MVCYLSYAFVRNKFQSLLFLLIFLQIHDQQVHFKNSKYHPSFNIFNHLFFLRSNLTKLSSIKIFASCNSLMTHYMNTNFSIRISLVSNIDIIRSKSKGAVSHQVIFSELTWIANVLSKVMNYPKRVTINNKFIYSAKLQSNTMGK